MANMRGKQEVGGDQVLIKTTEGGELASVDITRIYTAKGYGYQAMLVTPENSLIVRPTGTAMITLYNNTAKNFVMERAFAHSLISIADGDFGIWLCSHPIGMTAPANDISIRNSTSGLNSSTEGIVDQGATVNDNGWFPWGVNGTTVTATMPGALAEVNISGRIIVPPTGGISLSVVAQTAVVDICPGFHWFSVPISEFAVS